MKKPNILIVDDDKAARIALVDFLRGRHDCSFVEAADGETAIDFIKTNICDVIILDIKMPKKGGMTVIKEAKVIRPTIDILVVSAWDSEEVAKETLEAGACDYIVKPVDFKLISLKLAGILTKRGMTA